MKYEAIPQYQRAALELTGHYGLYSDEIRNAVINIAVRFNSKTCSCKEAKLRFNDGFDPVSDAMQFVDLLSACGVIKAKISRRKNLVRVINLNVEA